MTHIDHMLETVVDYSTYDGRLFSRVRCTHIGCGFHVDTCPPTVDVATANWADQGRRRQWEWSTAGPKLGPHPTVLQLDYPYRKIVCFRKEGPSVYHEGRISGYTEIGELVISDVCRVEWTHHSVGTATATRTSVPGDVVIDRHREDVW